MTYIRGDKAQFDAWEKLGNTGWNWDTMFEYYKKLERFFEPQAWQTAVGASFDPENHGSDGPLHVGFTPVLENGTLYGNAKESWGSLGQAPNRDVNSGDTQGFDVWPQTIDPETNTRWDSATAFYWPIQDRENLKLFYGTASRIVWKPQGRSDAPEAKGVEYFDQTNKAIIVEANREVILSAGSLRTPLILELSGIGNPAFLMGKGIETVVDSPSVGENMIDQPSNSLVFSSNLDAKGTSPYATFATAEDMFGGDLDSIAAATKHSLSQWAQKVAESSGGALNATALEFLFQLQHDLIFEQGVTLGEILATGSGDTLISAHWDLLPFSRGSVHLSSADDIHTPAIDPKLLSIDFDFKAQIALGRLASQFWNTSPIKDVVVSAVSPDAATLPVNATDAQWTRFTEGAAASNAHAIGTAAMMARELGGVVDPALKVYGTRNVRVVDASVLPMQISGHLTATLYAVAERAAEMIIDARKE